METRVKDSFKRKERKREFQEKEEKERKRPFLQQQKL